MKKIKLSIFTILILFVCTTVNALTIQQKWVQEEAPISGDFLSYQRLFSIGNDVVAIGNYGENEGHNIVRYDTNGNKLWSVETDKYTSFRINGDNVEGIYSSDILFVLDSYDSTGVTSNLINKNKEQYCNIITAEQKYYMLCFSWKRTSGVTFGATGDAKIIILYELDNQFNIINTYSKTLDFYNNSRNLSIFSYSELEEKIIIEYYGGNSKYNLFYFDINTKEYSSETIFDYWVNVSNNNLLYESDRSEKVRYASMYIAYKKTAFYTLTNLSKTITIDNYFFKKGEYYKDGYYYLSGFDLDGAILYKLDENLDLVWTYRYESEEEFSTLKNMVELNDYLFVLYETEIPNGVEYHGEQINPERYYSIVVLDAKGNLVMEYALDSEELQGSEFHNIIESDDGFILAGEIYAEENNANAIIAEFAVIFNIETKTDGNGTVEADHVEAESGTVIKFTVKPKEGYVLSVVKVTDANGNVITFTDYTFTMPNANVLIEATFVPIKTENPNTLSKNICLLVIVCLIVITLGSIIYRKIKWIKE